MPARIRWIPAREGTDSLHRNRTSFAAAATEKPVRGGSSVGRALESHSRGRGFDSPPLHLKTSLTGSLARPCERIAKPRRGARVDCPFRTVFFSEWERPRNFSATCGSDRVGPLSPFARGGEHLSWLFPGGRSRDLMMRRGMQAYRSIPRPKPLGRESVHRPGIRPPDRTSARRNSRSSCVLTRDGPRRAG